MNEPMEAGVECYDSMWNINVPLKKEAKFFKWSLPILYGILHRNK